jgi:predicted lipoprotein with Yx(FWY)xxD motif
MKTFHLAPFAFVLAAALAHAESPVKVADGMVVDTAGMTVYTFDKDSAGKSACNGPCATLWPPVMAAADAKAEGDMSIVTRDDGSKQWAWKGKPLYLYASDKKAGDKTGDNFKDVWHVIRP